MLAATKVQNFIRVWNLANEMERRCFYGIIGKFKQPKCLAFVRNHCFGSFPLPRTGF